MTSKTMDNPEKLVTQGTQDKDKQNNGQSRETGNIGYTRQRQSKTMDNPEKLVTQGTQDKDKQNNGQSRETGNIGYRRQ